MNCLKKLLQKKLEPQPEPIKEIIHIPYENPSHKFIDSFEARRDYVRQQFMSLYV